MKGYPVLSLPVESNSLRSSSGHVDSVKRTLKLSQKDISVRQHLSDMLSLPAFSSFAALKIPSTFPCREELLVLRPWDRPFAPCVYAGGPAVRDTEPCAYSTDCRPWHSARAGPTGLAHSMRLPIKVGDGRLRSRKFADMRSLIHAFLPLVQPRVSH